MPLPRNGPRAPRHQNRRKRGSRRHVYGDVCTIEKRGEELLAASCFATITGNA